MLYPINSPNFIFWLPLLLEILGNLCIVIICCSVCDIMNIENKHSFLMSLLNWVPRVLKTCPRANVPYVLTCSRGNVPCVLTCSRANVPCVLTCSSANLPCALTGNLPCVLTYRKYQQVFFSSFHFSFFVS